MKCKTTTVCKKICLVTGGGGGELGGGGKHFSKTFSIFHMLNSKNIVFNPYFSIGTCFNEKTAFVDKSRVELTIFFIEKISFDLKLFSGHFVRGPCLNKFF